MCPSSVRRPSTGYDSFDEFADHSTTNRQPYWFTPLLRPGSTIAICCWPEHQSLLPTSCSGLWMLQRELWAARRSTTAAWHTCFTLSYIGSMWQIKSHTSLGWRCTSACMARHRIICLSCVHRSLKLLNDSIFVPPAAIYSLFHGFSSIHTAFAVAGQMTWNLFQNNLPEPDMQTFLFDQYLPHWAEALFATMRYINWHLHLHLWLYALQ